MGPYQSTPKGQYVDGHEREDVVAYRKQVFIPKWKEIMNRMAVWDKDMKEHLPSGEGKRVIAWFHDESVFYAHDRQKKGWYHKDASAKPYAKGEGASLMIADFESLLLQDFFVVELFFSLTAFLYRSGMQDDVEDAVVSDAIHAFKLEYCATCIPESEVTHIRHAEGTMKDVGMFF